MSWLEEKDDYGAEISKILYDEGMIQTWINDRAEGWTLRNGLWSPYYIQCRPITSKKISQKLLKLIGNALGTLLKEETEGITKVIGVPLTGIPIATSITMCVGIPSCNARVIPNVKTIDDFHKAVNEGKFEKEEYGDHSLIEGDINNGDKFAIVDDIVTDFGTKEVILEQIKYVAKMKQIKISCNDVVVLVDREQGSKEAAHQLGINLYSLIPFKTEGIHWLKDVLDSEEYGIIVDYLNHPKKYQNAELKEKVIALANKK